MGIISLIVHTWGGVDKSHAVCPQKEALHAHQAFDAGVHTIGFLVLGTNYFTLCFGIIEINGIFVQLCGLSQIYVATHEPGRNTHHETGSHKLLLLFSFIYH